MGLTENSLVVRDRAVEAILDLDAKAAWTDLAAKDMPEAITTYVLEELHSGKSVDEVRMSLGMRAQSDVRWRKIMTSIRSGKRIDAVAIFSQWLDRNMRIATLLDRRLTDVLEGKVPFSKLTFEAIGSLASLQTMTIRMGKDLGVFTDPTDQGKGAGGGVTIVVQTLVPSPSDEAIVIHQEKQREKAQALLEMHRPKEKAKEDL